MKRFLFPLLVLAATATFAQTRNDDTPRGLFSAPMSHHRVLAGSFGELRDAHFHSGVDFKTQFVVGKEIHAPAQGEVVRASVSRGGYGLALYICHPNGFTTVYGHLNAFAPKIDSLVRAEQYARQSYTVNVAFPEGKIPVEAGELVAWSGNTGSSMGPHLHFEVRRTQDGQVLNPLLFGFDVADKKAPTVRGVYVMNTESSDSLETLTQARRIPFGKDSQAHISANGRIAFLVDAYDTMDDAPNKNGVYGIDLYVNGQKAYGMRMDGFYFEHTGLIDRHIAYDHYADTGDRLVKCFVEPFNCLTIYDDTCPASPILEVGKDSLFRVRIDVYDLAGNTTRREITVSWDPTARPYSGRHTAEPTENSHLLFFEAKRYNRIEYGDFRAEFPAGTFYKDLYFDFEPIDSATFRLHNGRIPPAAPFTVSFDVSRLPDSLQRKTVVASPFTRRDGSIGYRYFGGRVENGRIALRTSALTSFTTALDTIPPQIERGKWAEGEKLKSRYLRMYIRDGQTGIASFNAYIDGRWTLMSYESKRRELTLDVVREKIPAGRHTFRLEVTDGVGNQAAFEGHFSI